MKYVISERKPTEKNMKNAANKARADVEMILQDKGYVNLPIVIPFKGKLPLLASVKEQYKNYKIWKKSLADLKNGDKLVIQFPLMSKSLFLSHLLKGLHQRGVDITVLIHDLESLRYINETEISTKRKIRILREEQAVLGRADKIIAHNPSMCQYLIEKGYSADKVKSLEIFDYLLPNDFEISPKELSNRVIIAGNLDPEKVGYLKEIGKISGPLFELFGANYRETKAENIIYHGSFMPEELPKNLSGSFGLVWDGDSIETCSGMYGDYLRFNNPHKTSLYLACGFPVIIWSQSALAPFIRKNNLGLTVDSLEDLKRLSQVTETEYREMVTNVLNISNKLRQGFFLDYVIDKGE